MSWILRENLSDIYGVDTFSEIPALEQSQLDSYLVMPDFAEGKFHSSEIELVR